jgi:hypothetical protein
MADVLGSAVLAAGTRSSASKPAVLGLPAVRWLDELPDQVRPDRTAARFPHIVNTLCTRWLTPQACLDYFDELLLDNRGDRTGFPPLIARELALLKDYYESAVFPTDQTAWDELTRRSRAYSPK